MVVVDTMSPEGVVALQLVPAGLAFGLLLALVGLAGLVIGLYVLLRGGRGQGGGLWIFPERFIHAVAGLRIIVGGAMALFFSILILWGYFSG
jgi:hypothetical protein